MEDKTHSTLLLHGGYNATTKDDTSGHLFSGSREKRFSFQTISSDTNRFVDRCLLSVTIVSLVLKDALTGTQAGAGFVSTRKYSIQ